MAKTQRIRIEKNSENRNVESAIALDEIAQRAYALYLGRGGEDGHDLDDWLTAERELQEELSFRQEGPRSTSAA